MFFQSLISFTDDEEKEKEKPERQDKILVYGLWYSYFTFQARRKISVNRAWYGTIPHHTIPYYHMIGVPTLIVLGVDNTPYHTT